MASLFRGLMIFVLLACVSACTMKPVRNPSREIPPSPNASSLQVKQAIISSLTKRGWTVGTVTPTQVQANITVREQFKAQIAIDYSATHYTINYRDSEGLKYNNGKINRTYNRWVIFLDKEINRELHAARIDTQNTGPDDGDDDDSE